VHDETGCQGGLGKGNYTMGSAGGGGGHGGKGGPGIYDSKRSEGGVVYGNRQLPCELGSGGGTSGVSMSSAGGGVIGESHQDLIITMLLISSMLLYYCIKSHLSLYCNS
jgi:hypothetical protein